MLRNKTKQYTYDNMGRLVGESVANAAGVPLTNTYKYDLYGNRAEEAASIPDSLITDTITYTYDLNNRLTDESNHVYDEYNNTNEYLSTSYSYDDNGNMTEKQCTSSADGICNTEQYSYDKYNLSKDVPRL